MTSKIKQLTAYEKQLYSLLESAQSRSSQLNEMHFGDRTLDARDIHHKPKDITIDRLPDQEYGNIKWIRGAGFDAIVAATPEGTIKMFTVGTPQAVSAKWKMLKQGDRSVLGESIGTFTIKEAIEILKDPILAESKLVMEKSVSKKQARTMAAAAHDPKFAKKVGIKQSVAKEFNKADKGTKQLSKAMKEKKTTESVVSEISADTLKSYIPKALADNEARRKELKKQGKTAWAKTSIQPTDSKEQKKFANRDRSVSAAASKLSKKDPRPAPKRVEKYPLGGAGSGNRSYSESTEVDDIKKLAGLK